MENYLILPQYKTSYDLFVMIFKLEESLPKKHKIEARKVLDESSDLLLCIYDIRKNGRNMINHTYFINGKYHLRKISNFISASVSLRILNQDIAFQINLKIDLILEELNRYGSEADTLAFKME
ncbi:hypothetical protein CLU81_0585 [Flavobacterium sp. 9]|uniref:hypothetical protein n=1 Tax=Flavobacterium sp. 9 TaxID=2035198 RepID=UPI000C190BE6|nr:hypothetical protein [Flavobacterium sp. 9]PIF30177.1 hypothetical protein CLU81_0585 [Flavobacterium sp. 9]